MLNKQRILLLLFITYFRLDLLLYKFNNNNKFDHNVLL